jgi:chemotaxis protein histidine kinase CheA
VVRIRAERGRGFLRIVVEDDGRGIAPHPLPTGSAGGVPVSGRRVGLLAAAAALEPVGGRLALRGEPGRGTLVELSLPRGASRSGGGSAPSEGRRSPGPRRGRP